jgi:multidrug transporter EmrE-like cation transporter
VRAASPSTGSSSASPDASLDQRCGLDDPAPVSEKPEKTRHPLPSGDNTLSLSGFIQLVIATAIFLFAATLAKSWALAPSLGKLFLTLLLYSAGNLIMLRLVREFGMSSAFSLSAILQLVAVNVIALAWFGERLSFMQSSGVVLAIIAVGLITLGPSISK